MSVMWEVFLYVCDVGSLSLCLQCRKFVFYELGIYLKTNFVLCLQRDSMVSVVDVVSDHLTLVGLW